MADITQTIDQMMQIDGVLGAAILDTESGLPLAAKGNGTFDMEVTSGGAVDVLRAWNRGSERTDRQQPVETVIGLYPETIAMIKVLTGRNSNLAMMLLMERTRSNQALANHKLGLLANDLQL